MLRNTAETDMLHYENAVYFAEQVEGLIKNGMLRWTTHRFGSPQYGSILAEDDCKGAISQYFHLESHGGSQRVSIEITETISVEKGTAEDKGNLYLTLWIENTVLNTEYHFALEQTPAGGGIKDTAIRSPHLDHTFAKLADTAIRDYLENYDAVAADLRKKDPYIEREYQKYRGLPIVRLGSRLQREQKYLLFHQCVLSPSIRRQTLREMNLPTS